jgi:hypothetical protein
VDSQRDLVLRENHVSARGDVHVWVQEEVARQAGQTGAKSEKDYLVCADAVDADLVGATAGALTIERLVATGGVRFSSGDLRSRADQLTMQTRWWHPPGARGCQPLSTLFAEGRGRPCVFEQNGRELTARTFFYNRSSGDLRAQDVLLTGLSP